jgi:hypothetical protein
MPPRELFHYTTRKIALEKILTTEMLRFGQLGLTNDPKETQNWYLAVSFPNETAHKTFSLNEQKKLWQETNNILFKEWKVLCFTIHHPSLKKNRVIEREDDEEPFLRGYCRPRMWAHYADNHKGVCLKFNGDELNKIIQQSLSSKHRVFQGTVKYDDYNSIGGFALNYSEIKKYGLKNALREYFYKHYKDFFLHKSKDWKTEYEYRWIIHNNKNSAVYIPIEHAIEEVVVGVDFPKADEKPLIHICKKLNIRASKLQWQNGFPILRIGKIYEP